MDGSTEEQHDTLHDVPFVAAYIGRSEHYVRRLVQDQKIGHYRVSGKTVRFTDQHIAEFLSEHEVTPRHAGEAVA